MTTSSGPAPTGVPGPGESEVRDWIARRRYVKTSTADVAYNDVGQGEPVLLLHGFPLNSFQWRDVVAELAQTRRCIAPDFLGLGYTDVKDGAGVAFRDQVDMLMQLLDHLDVGTVEVIANDSGTGIAQMLAAQFPARVRSMLLTNGDVETDSPPAPLAPFVQLAKAGMFADQIVRASVDDKDQARSEEGFGGLTYTDPARLTDAAIDHYFGPLVSSERRRATADAYASALDPNPMAGLETALSRCGVPTAVVWGTGDVIFSASDPDYLKRVLPTLRSIHLVEGARLFFPEEFPALICEEARALWASL